MVVVLNIDEMQVCVVSGWVVRKLIEFQDVRMQKLQCALYTYKNMGDGSTAIAAVRGAHLLVFAEVITD
jgi:hypothetical protein